MTISWAAVQSIQAADVAEHFGRAQALGLECPLDVFEQLFHDPTGRKDFDSAVRSVDWANVLWEETELSGVALRRVAVPRPYQHAVDEARWRTLHRFTALAWLAGLGHSLGEGTDAGQIWFLAMVAIVAIPALVLLAARLLRVERGPVRAAEPSVAEAR